MELLVKKKILIYLCRQIRIYKNRKFKKHWNSVSLYEVTMVRIHQELVHAKLSKKYKLVSIIIISIC